MPEENQVQSEKALLAAEGYTQLGMLDDALAELDRIPADSDLLLAAAKLRLQILMRSRRWEEAVNIGAWLCQHDPAEPDHWIHHAFSLHEIGRTREAHALLLSGPASLGRLPIYHYNLGCYDAVLGNIEEALHHLRKAFSLDKQFRVFAQSDPDLVNLQGML